MVESLTEQWCFFASGRQPLCGAAGGGGVQSYTTLACTTLISSLRTKNHVFLSVCEVLTLCPCPHGSPSGRAFTPLDDLTRCISENVQENIIMQNASNNVNQAMFVYTRPSASL